MSLDPPSQGIVELIPNALQLSGLKERIGFFEGHLHENGVISRLKRGGSKFFKAWKEDIEVQEFCEAMSMKVLNVNKGELARLFVAKACAYLPVNDNSSFSGLVDFLAHSSSFATLSFGLSVISSL